jgi:hypothetical protein
MASEPVATITHRLLGYVALPLVVVLLCWIACSETFGESAEEFTRLFDCEIGEEVSDVLLRSRRASLSSGARF